MTLAEAVRALRSAPSAMAKQLADLQAIDSCAVLLCAVAASNLTEQNQSNDQPDYLTDKERTDKRIGSTPIVTQQHLELTLHGDSLAPLNINVNSPLRPPGLVVRGRPIQTAQDIQETPAHTYSGITP